MSATHPVGPAPRPGSHQVFYLPATLHYAAEPVCVQLAEHTNSRGRTVSAAPVYFCANSGLIRKALAHTEQVVDITPPAESDLKSIKLLRILPQQGSAHGSARRIACSLETFNWEHSPEYIALSYVWGVDHPGDEILVNGVPFAIRSNLHSALTHFAACKLSIYLWADAICINQTDEEEKSVQVQHMSDIFKRAITVFAWLGPLDDGKATTSRAGTPGNLIDHLEELGSHFWEHAGIGEKLSDASFDLPIVFERCLPVVQQRFSLEAGEKAFPLAAYTDFSSRLYWQRMWILQEVYLASDLWFFYGPRRISRKTLSGALILLQEFHKYIISTTPATGPDNPNVEKFAFEASAFPEMHRLLIYTTIYPSHLVSLRIAMSNFCVKELPRGSKATDPRDMIFGLLGFGSPQEKTYIKADYSKPVRETYMDVTRAMVFNGFADILSWSQPNKKLIQGLPSWVPDFSATIYEPLCSQGQAKAWLPLFDAAGGRPAALWPTDQTHSDTLSLLGMTLDEVSFVGSLWFPRGAGAAGSISKAMESRSASYESIMEFFHSIEDAIQSSRSQGQLSSPEVEEILCRVACADQLVLDSKLCRAPRNLTEHYHRAERAVRMRVEEGIEDPLPAKARPYVETLLRWVNKRPFATIGGYVGLGPAGARNGDVTAILHGFSAPYILRKLPHDKSKYEVIGEAYVLGIMDGEAIKGITSVEEVFHLV